MGFFHPVRTSIIIITVITIIGNRPGPRVKISINRRKSKPDLRHQNTPTPIFSLSLKKKKSVRKQSILLVLGVNDYCQR